MEFVNCPECGIQVSSNAEGCPNCGYPIRAKYSENRASFKGDISEKVSDTNYAKGTEYVMNQENKVPKEQDTIGTLGFFMAIASFIPGVVWILSGGTKFLGIAVWILLILGFILSFIGIFTSKPRDIALTGIMICIITVMFTILLTF